MKNYKAILWTHRTNANGDNPVVLRITKDRKVKYISINLFATPDQWDKEFGRYNIKKNKVKSVHPDHVEFNAFLSSQETKAQDVIDEFNRNKIDWTLNQFDESFHHRAKKGKVQHYVEKLIQTLLNTGHTGNAKCYSQTLNMLILFDKKFDSKIFSEIDIKFVRDFDAFLQTPRQSIYVSTKGNTKIVERDSCSGNTRKYYIKALRAILHRANADNEGSVNTFPFGKNGFNLSELSEETAKRYLPSDYMAKLKSTTSPNNTNEYARKLFLFSYYSHGMSIVDMAHLTPSNIQRLEGGEFIIYKRIKTINSKNSKAIRIKLTAELKSIISGLCLANKPVDNFLLPIVSIAGYSGEQLYNHIRVRTKKYNSYLKELAVEFEFTNINLTSYVSRHTMAMTLQGGEVSREKISQILGHKNLSTTNTYLDSFGSDAIDEAVKIL